MLELNGIVDTKGYVNSMNNQCEQYYYTSSIISNYQNLV